MGPTPPQQPPQQGEGSRALRGFTLLLTNVTKVVGLVIAVNEALLRPSIRESAMALAGAMLFGAQTVENVLLGLIDRMFPRDGGGG